jgi:hypothetical protein
MSILPRPLEAYVSGVGLVCSKCGAKVVDAIPPPDGERYLCPSCAIPLPYSDDELTRAALADPAALEEPRPDGSAAWRLVSLLAIAILALAGIFWLR